MKPRWSEKEMFVGEGEKVAGRPLGGSLLYVSRGRTWEWDHQLQQAAAVQRCLTPRRLELPGFEAAVGFEPLQAVGGDYVDMVPMPDGRVLLALADVCGKGFAAALVANSMHATIRNSISDGYGIVDVMERLNHYFRTHLPEGPFVTLAVVAVDLESGKTEALNAGHPPPLVVQPSGTTRRLKSGGTFPLGIADLDAPSETDTVAPGELLLLVTDGWTELTDPSDHMLGLTGVIRHVSSVYSQRHDASLDEVLSEAIAHLSRFQGRAPAHDDRTLMLVRRPGLEPRPLRFDG